MPAVVGHREALLERLDKLGEIVHPAGIARFQCLGLRILATGT